MRYLLYCICEPTPDSCDLPAGVENCPVVVVTDGDLCAVVSPIEQRSDITRPGVERILAYENIVETLHRRHAVLPVRYGCVFDDASEVIDLLRSRRGVYQAALCQLRGRVEMGIRALLHPTDEAQGRHGHSRTLTDLFHSNAQGIPPGRAYLAARRLCYAERDRLDEQLGKQVEAIRQAFAGLFVESVLQDRPFQNAHDGATAISIVFLVDREKLGPFRRAFLTFSQAQPTRLLLSGPWPPYSFVPSPSPSPAGGGPG